MIGWCVHHAQRSLGSGTLDLRCEWSGPGDDYRAGDPTSRTVYVLRWTRDLCSHEARLDAIRNFRPIPKIVRVAVRERLAEALSLARKWEREVRT